MDERIHRYQTPLSERKLTREEKKNVAFWSKAFGRDLLNPVSVAPVGRTKKVKTIKSTGEVVKRGSRQELVNALVAKNPNLPRAEMIKLIMDEIGMTKAGASTYFHNAKKAA